jgi:RimJ/RimL family protein N-acetyltransferase
MLAVSQGDATPTSARAQDHPDRQTGADKVVRMVQWTSTDDTSRYAHSLFEGEQVRLRGTTESDLETIARWYNDPTMQVLQSGRVMPVLESQALEETRSWNAAKDGGGAGLSVELISSGELIGQVTLWGARPATRAATFAIMLGPDFMSRGYGTEATRLMVGYGFRELGLNRIELRTWAFNTRAIAAYSKAGFSVEGRRRQVLFHEGAFHDEMIMSILAEEYFGG